MGKNATVTTTTETVLEGETNLDLVEIVKPDDVIVGGQNLGAIRIYNLSLTNGEIRKVLTSTVLEFEITETKEWKISEVLKCEIKYTDGNKREITIKHLEKVMFNKLNAQDMFRALESLTGKGWKKWHDAYGNWRKNGKTGKVSQEPIQTIEVIKI